MTYELTINNRKIGIQEYGSKNGWPVFYFHGFPGSRMDGGLLHFETQASRTRMIAIDRPGIGLSEYQPQRTLLDWSTEIVLIADQLGIDTFSIIGFSGGGPYALACAFAIPHRIRSIAFASGMGPYEYNESRKNNAMFVPRRIPILRQLIASQLYNGIRNYPDTLITNFIRLLPREDRAYFALASNKEKLLLSFRENFKQGTRGFLKEAEIYRQPWGFKLSDITLPVHLWQGTTDRNVSVRSSKRISMAIPYCKTHFIRNEGHFSLAGKYLKNIIYHLR